MYVCSRNSRATALKQLSGGRSELCEQRVLKPSEMRAGVRLNSKAMTVACPGTGQRHSRSGAPTALLGRYCAI
jgi:hypothetical protein